MAAAIYEKCIFYLRILILFTFCSPTFTSHYYINSYLLYDAMAPKWRPLTNIFLSRRFLNITYSWPN